MSDVKQVLTLGGLTNVELDLIVMIGTDHPFISPTRDRVIAIPFRNGQYDFGSDLESKGFILNCAIDGDNSADLQVKARRLARHLVDETGRSRELSLIFDSESHIEYTVRYSGSIDIERLAHIGMFRLPLVAFFPFGKSITDSLVASVFEASPDSMIVVSNGDIDTPAIITLENSGTTVSTFTLSHSEKNVDIGYTGTFVFGDVLLIDMNRKVVTLNDENALKFIRGDFFELSATTNTIIYQDIGGSRNIDVSFKFNDRFI